MHRARIAMVGVVLIAAAGAGYWVWNSRFSPEATGIERAKRYLKDPDSARFDDIHTTPKGVVCGTVNAKNSLGGYVGYRQFILFPDGDMRWEPLGAPSTAPTIEQVNAAQERVNFVTLALANCV